MDLRYEVLSQKVLVQLEVEHILDYFCTSLIWDSLHLAQLEVEHLHLNLRLLLYFSDVGFSLH